MLAKLGKFFLYLLATTVVLLAVAVGVLRIVMPQLPEHRDEVIARISEAIDGEVSFERIDARWRLRGPEILFHDVVIGERIGERRITPVRAELITVGISLSHLLFSRELEVRRIGIQGSELRVTRSDDGIYLQDALMRAAVPEAQSAPTAEGLQLPIGSNLDVRLDDVMLEYDDLRDDRPAQTLDVLTAGLDLDRRTLQIDTSMRLVGNERMRVSLLLNGTLPARSVAGIWAGDWSVSADIDAVSASLLATLAPASWRLPSTGDANLLADASVSDGVLQAAVVTVDADDLAPPGGGDASALSGRFEWSRTDDGWLCAISDFRVAVAERRWPPASLLLNLSRDAESTVLNITTANMTVYDLPYLASFLPTAAAQALLATELSGTLIDADGLLHFTPGIETSELGIDDLNAFEVNAQFENLSVASTARLPGFRNLSGEMRVTEDAGRIELNASDLAVLFPGVFGQPVELDALVGTLVWRSNDRGVSLLSDAIRIESPSLTAESSLELLLGADDGGPIIDLQSEWSIADLTAAEDLLPSAILSPKLAGWLSQAFEAGRIEDGTFTLKGDLRDFPFKDGSGTFSASATARDVVMRYARDWPPIEQLTASVELDGLRLSTATNSGVSGGLPFRNARAAFADLTSGVLTLETGGNATLTQLYEFAGSSPLRRLFGNQFDNLRIDGDASYATDLRVPLKAITDFSVDARISASDANVSLAFLPFGLQALNGDVRIDRTGAFADGLSAQFLNQPMTIDMAPLTEQPEYSVVIRGDGTLTETALLETLRLPLNGRISGSAPFTATVRLPKAVADGSPAAVTVSVVSELEGLAVDLPYPVGKTAAQQMRHELTLEVADALTTRFVAGELIDVAALLQRDGQYGNLQLDRATIHLGEGRALMPSVPGLFIDGSIDRLRLGDWLSLNLTGGGLMTDNLTSVAVEVGDLYAFGQRIRDIRASLERSGQNWLVDVQSAAVEGAISVPIDLSLGEPVVLDMSRLKLLEADPESTGAVDPTTLPPLRIRAEQFALGDREFGALSADISKVSDGLSATSIKSAAEAFSIDATGDWLLDPVEPSGSRTTLDGTVTSSDVQRMMNQLGYAPGINAESLTSELQVSWAGGPSAEFVASLDGDVSLKIANGTLDEVEPGAGRVVGLMSVAELPRRLALDFRDVFQKGFKFDEIVGDFRLVNGDAYTCNLSLKGSSADVGLVGRASLDKRNYNQTAVVSVKVGNTLPAVGAVVAGPQVGAALLLFSQIFKKPLRGMTEVYYQINGSWDDPSIDRTDAARFVATSELAGCLPNGGG